MDGSVNLLAYLPLEHGVTVLLFLWPFLYHKLKDGRNRLLFVASCFGFTVLLYSLVEVLLYPLVLFVEYIQPQLIADGATSLGWLHDVDVSLNGVGGAIIHYSAYFVMPFLVFRKFKNEFQREVKGAE